MRQRVVTVHDLFQSEITNELVLDQFGSEQFGDTEDLISGDTDEEGDGVEDVSEDELEGECMEAETPADPSKETVNGGYEGDDSQDVGPEDIVVCESRSMVLR